MSKYIQMHQPHIFLRQCILMFKGWKCFAKKCKNCLTTNQRKSILVRICKSSGYIWQYLGVALLFQILTLFSYANLITDAYSDSESYCFLSLYLQCCLPCPSVLVIYHKIPFLLLLYITCSLIVLIVSIVAEYHR